MLKNRKWVLRLGAAILGVALVLTTVSVVSAAGGPPQGRGFGSRSSKGTGAPAQGTRAAQVPQVVDSATEEALITGLRAYSELIEGEYPSALDFTRIGMDFYGMASAVDEEQRKKVRALGEPQALMDKLMPLYAGTLFFQEMVREGVEAEYFGPEVTPGDAQAELVR